MRPQLPVLGQAQPERADAARNRQKILDAAARLLAECGGEHLSLDEVARAAGVGVGTVYRRFGDRSGLLFALIDERERRFQEAFMSGPPPLGPGAPPVERITAFLHALVDRIAAQENLFLLLERNPSRKGDSGPYQIHRLHLAALIAEVKPQADAMFLADALLAPLSANLIFRRGYTHERIKAGLESLVKAVTA
ncbi:TetR/AcrR family transcriptional regulator [Thermoactinospora rubra]|uniref:TetR/AcrR family transcriptional regulator n=1 Tax=Thermoactinospora rubra TaxID=1088767 RepID=UPI00197D8319|nr:TetR/AcrR family transcriptional regulator [Thermoactinospora rubra]